MHVVADLLNVFANTKKSSGSLPRPPSASQALAEESCSLQVSTICLDDIAALCTFEAGCQGSCH